MRIRFVTGNPGKLREAAEFLSPLGYEVKPAPADLVEIQADTLEQVAAAKADAARALVAPPYFVEDAGLFIDALHGFPGVYSRYAFRTIGWRGPLRLLGDGQHRSARFAAVIALVEDGGPARLFKGECEGTIALEGRGDQGFGFDPIFIPEGERRTFAELDSADKSRLSHRGRALRRLAEDLGRRPPSRKD